MSNRTDYIPDDLYAYLLSHGVPGTGDALIDQVMLELRDVTHNMPGGVMQIAAEQGQFMCFLTNLIGAKNVLEIGTFTGYSALAMAAGLPADGKLISCDRSEEWTNIAQQYWQKAKLDHKIELRLGAALETLDQLIAEQKLFDIIFIDADKVNYMAYYDKSMQLLSAKGLILIDNVFAMQNITKPDDQIRRENLPATRAIRELNQRLKNEPGIDLCMLPIGDGLTLIRKR